MTEVILEVMMSKLLKQPSSRLVCFGDARRLTNAPGQQGSPEPVFPLEYIG